MKIPYKIGDYEQMLEVRDNNVVEWDCTCKDFEFRHIKTKGMCKHLKQLESSILLNFIKQVPGTMGVTHLTDRQKLCLREMVEFTCQHCKKGEIEVGVLSPHRLIRGHAGGKYIPNNILMVCNECHRIFHTKEPGGGTA